MQYSRLWEHCEKTVAVNPGDIILLNSNVIHADGGSNEENTYLLPGVVKSVPVRKGKGCPSNQDKQINHKQITHLSFHAYIYLGKVKTCTEGYVKSQLVSIDDNQIESVDNE